MLRLIRLLCMCCVFACAVGCGSPEPIEETEGKACGFVRSFTFPAGANANNSQSSWQTGEGPINIMSASPAQIYGSGGPYVFRNSQPADGGFWSTCKMLFHIAVYAGSGTPVFGGTYGCQEYLYVDGGECHNTFVPENSVHVDAGGYKIYTGATAGHWVETGLLHFQGWNVGLYGQFP